MVVAVEVIPSQLAMCVAYRQPLHGLRNILYRTLDLRLLLKQCNFNMKIPYSLRGGYIYQCHSLDCCLYEIQET